MNATATPAGRYAVVVDPLSTGHEYGPAFRAAGLRTVAVLTPGQPIAPIAGTWHPENFEDVHVFDGDVRWLATLIAQYDPLCIVPGSETGVELADALVEQLLPGSGNVPGLTRARRDKWHMAQALARAGVPHLRQFCSADVDELAAWVADAGLADRALVVKPPKSMATDEVHLVTPEEDLRPLARRILRTRNVAGLPNTSVLVQEHAAGTEYLVDTYSVDGRHGLVDVCRYTKSRRGDRIGLYNRVEFLPPDAPEVAQLQPYAQQVLDAVGIRNGCGHAEIMMTADGPRLIEVGARPAGGGHQFITEAATGDNHIQRTVRHRVHGEFRPSYELRQHLSAVFISSPATGTWLNAEIFDEVDALPTLWRKHFPFGTGDVVRATEDLLSHLAWVVLVGQDRAAVEADVRRVAELERRIEIAPLTEAVPA
jgi:biotin carboxylase